jgi:RNA polymerase sigma factor
MNESGYSQLLFQAREGNDLDRERLIRRYRPTIINTVGHVCKRYITWSDEESSIGLLAFNRAIDTYDATAGRTFLNYAYLLIHRDLVDYFRREQRQKHASLDYSPNEVEGSANSIEIEKSLETYQVSAQSSELVEEILELDQSLSQYGISFEELEDVSPKHKESRYTLMEMAKEFIEDEELVHHFTTKHRFPTTLFTKKTGYSAKTIERFRKYLITLVLLLLHPEWKYLSEFIEVLPGNEGS